MGSIREFENEKKLRANFLIMLSHLLEELELILKL